MLIEPISNPVPSQGETTRTNLVLLGRVDHVVLEGDADHDLAAADRLGRRRAGAGVVVDVLRSSFLR